MFLLFSIKFKLVMEVMTERRLSPSGIALGIVNFVIGLAEILIGLRIILKLFGANVNAEFVSWIYDTTQPLLQPFIGMFPAPAIEGAYVIEFSALFALLIYALIGVFLIELIHYLGICAVKRVSKE